MKRYRSTESFTINGHWKLPQSEKWYPGQLTFDPEDGFTLDMFNSEFEDMQSYVEGKISAGPAATAETNLESGITICGHGDGVEITLLEVYCVKKKERIGAKTPFSESKYVCQIGLFGAWVESINSKVVKKYFIQVDHLNSIVGAPKCLAAETEFKKDANPETRTKYKPSPSDNVPFISLQGTVELRIHSWGYVPHLNVTPYAFTSETKEFIQLEFLNNEPLGLDTVHDRITELSALVELAVNQKIDLIEASIEIMKDQSSQTAYLLMARSCAVKTADSSLAPQDLLINGRDLDFLELFCKWDELYNEKSHLVGLLLEVITSSTTYLETKFLLSTVLLEAFHKKTFGKEVKDCLTESKDQFKAIFPNENYSRCSSRNSEPFFKLRVIDLYYRLPDAVRSKLIPDLKNWSYLTNKLRNTVVHEAFLSEAAFQQAFAIARLNAVLVQALLLQKLGVSTEFMEEALRTNKKWSAAVNSSSAYLQTR